MRSSAPPRLLASCWFSMLPLGPTRSGTGLNTSLINQSSIISLLRNCRMPRGWHAQVQDARAVCPPVLRKRELVSEQQEAHSEVKGASIKSKGSTRSQGVCDCPSVAKAHLLCGRHGVAPPQGLEMMSVWTVWGHQAHPHWGEEGGPNG